MTYFDALAILSVKQHPFPGNQRITSVYHLIFKKNIYIIMWSCPGNMPKLISLLYWMSDCPGNMPKYYSTKYHYRNLHEV